MSNHKIIKNINKIVSKIIKNINKIVSRIIKNINKIVSKNGNKPMKEAEAGSSTGVPSDNINMNSTEQEKSPEDYVSADENKQTDVNRLADEIRPIDETMPSDEDSPSENITKETTELHKKERNRIIIKSLRILCSIGFFVFLGLFINEVWYQPYKMHKSIEQAQALFNRPDPTGAAGQEASPSPVPSTTATPEDLDGSGADNESEEPTPTLDPNRDEKGRLLAFKDLLAVNAEVKGWLNISNINGENDTKIDYVVMQSSYDDPEYYLHREWATKEYLKGGSLFLDKKSSVERNTQNTVIYGHNMTSTDDMFHYLLQYKEKDFYDGHPIIRFDTIYRTGDWKVFAVFITNGSNEKEELFNYTRASFKNDRDFLNFVYQLRIRSYYNAEDVDINGNDQILTLSTCSYELDNYRTIVVARKVRDGEDPTVNVENVAINPDPLYPDSFYKQYGGTPPELAANFDIALDNGEISWYNPMGN